MRKKPGTVGTQEKGCWCPMSYERSPCVPRGTVAVVRGTVAGGQRSEANCRLSVSGGVMEYCREGVRNVLSSWFFVLGLDGNDYSETSCVRKVRPMEKVVKKILGGDGGHSEET